MSIWEKDIYSKHKQLNKYPYDKIVSTIFRKYGSLNKNERKKIKILEVGCGSGNNIHFLSKEGFNVYGNDISVSAINFAKKYLSDSNLEAKLDVASFTDLPYEDNYFDFVIDRLSITHCPELIDKALQEVKRVMKNDGEFLSIFFNTEHTGYLNSKDDKNNIVNEFGLLKIKNNYLSFTPTYFIDSNNTVIKKYFKICSSIKITHEYNNGDICGETLFILNK